MNKIYKVGYLRVTSNDTGWFYEMVEETQVLERVRQLLNEEHIKKISIAKKEN